MRAARVFVPAELITTIEPGAITIRNAPLDLQPFARRAQEVLLKEDVLDRQLINVDGARLVRTNEIELAGLTAGTASSAWTPDRVACSAA